MDSTMGKGRINSGGQVSVRTPVGHLGTSGEEVRTVGDEALENLVGLLVTQGARRESTKRVRGPRRPGGLGSYPGK